MTTPGASVDKAAITSLIQSQTDAWRRGDAKAFADPFLPDGSFVNVLGALSYGRDAFQSQHARIFATVYKDSSIRLPIRRIQFVRDDVAVVDIDAELSGYTGLPPGLRTEPDGVIRTRLQEVLVKESGRWMIAAFHNVDIKPTIQSRITQDPPTA
jgi:uncharacterized protein (TIGR02246 family)